MSKNTNKIADCPSLGPDIFRPTRYFLFLTEDTAAGARPADKVPDGRLRVKGHYQ